MWSSLMLSTERKEGAALNAFNAQVTDSRVQTSDLGLYEEALAIAGITDTVGPP